MTLTKQVSGMNRRYVSLFAFLALLTVAGCGGSEAVFGIGQSTGNFNATITGRGDSGDRSTVWANTAASANVALSLAVGSSGQVTVTIRDAGGTQVYRETVTTDGPRSLSGPTATGASGDWEVFIEVVDLDGTANVSVAPA